MMLCFLLLLSFISQLCDAADPEMLVSADGDIQISRDFNLMKITIAKQNRTEYVNLNAGTFHKSIMNFGQLSPATHLKLLKNDCLNIIAYGTSVSCGSSDIDLWEDHPRSARDAWPYRLQTYMNEFLPTCLRDGQVSQHKLIRVHCNRGNYAGGENFFDEVPTTFERGATQDFWVEGLLMGRLNELSLSEVDLSIADLVIVEAMDDMDAPFVGIGSIKHAAKATERFVQVVRRHKSKPSMIYLGASIQLGQSLFKLSSDSSVRDAYDGVLEQLPVAKRYSIPYISAVDAFSPFVSDEMKQWWVDIFLSGWGSHPSRTGHKIDALLLLYYFKQVQLSLQNPISTSIDTYKYTDIESVTPLHFTEQQLKEHVEELHHQPLTIILNSFTHLRGPYMKGSGAWVTTNETPYGHNMDNIALQSDQVNGAPFTLIFLADMLSFHFHKQHIRVVVGKAHTDMGSVQVQVRMNDKVVSETVIDCLSKKLSVSTEGHEDTTELGLSNVTAPVTAGIVWYIDEIHILSKLEIDATSVMTISFTVLESSPKREHNMVQLAYVSLL